MTAISAQDGQGRYELGDCLVRMLASVQDNVVGISRCVGGGMKKEKNKVSCQQQLLSRRENIAVQEDTSLGILSSRPCVTISVQVAALADIKGGKDVGQRMMPPQ